MEPDTIAQLRDLGWDVRNPSWPAGPLTASYDAATDTYRLVTSTGAVVARIGPTLLAAAVVRLHNALCVAGGQQHE